MRVKYEDLLEKFQRILESRDFSGKHAKDVATIFAGDNLSGVYSHGVNHFSRVMEYLDKGEIDSATTAACKSSMGAIERWNGHGGFGPLSAKLAIGRTAEPAREYGVGMVALGNNNRQTRGGSCGWQAADKGCIGVCWFNTMPNMSAWGGRDRKIGNNPLIMSIPRSNGKHAVIDYTVSQLSYGKIEEIKLRGQQLPVPGDYDTKDSLITDPAEIEKTWRMLPMGYWKGGGISIILNLIATVLTNGNSVGRIGTFGDEVGLGRIVIATDSLGFNAPEKTDSIADEILTDIKSSEPIKEGGEMHYPRELGLIIRKTNTRDRIPVIDKVWGTLSSLEC